MHCYRAYRMMESCTSCKVFNNCPIMYNFQILRQSLTFVSTVMNLRVA